MNIDKISYCWSCGRWNCDNAAHQTKEFVINERQRKQLADELDDVLIKMEVAFIMNDTDSLEKHYWRGKDISRYLRGD